MLVNKREDLLEKGFQLAYFLIPDRSIAIQILAAAMSKFKAQRSRETKRAYWRDKYLKRKITRIARNDGDLLQWLIYFEAEDYEKQQERTGEQTTRDMVIRYIKYLVQVTTAMSSFYVNVGLHRLLYNYSTYEVQKVYESVTQHYPGDQEYRKVKATLMNKLQARFNDFLRTCTVHHGEARFEVSEHQDSWAELVDRCLRAFTPWSTAQTCDLLADLDTGTSALPSPLSVKAERGSVDQDMVETHRCHVFTEPSCFSRLAKRFGLDPPRARLAVPQFYMKQTIHNQRNSGNGSETTAGLTQEERRQIMDRLAVEADRRQRVPLKLLRISADGSECGCLIPGERSSVHFDIEEGVRLIEIWTEDQGEDLPLATHWIEYSQSQGIVPTAATVDLGRGRALALQVIPKAKSDETGGASIFVKWQPVSRLAAWGDFLRNPRLWFYALPKYALAPLLLIAIGGIVGTVKYRNDLLRQQAASGRLRQELEREKAARSSLEHTLEIERGTSTESYLLVPNDLQIRGPRGPKEPVISLSSHAPLVILELPIGGEHGESYRAVLKPFLEDREIFSESFSNSTHTPVDDKLKFSLPLAFVEDGKHYVVTLNAVNSAGKMSEVRKFTFYVKKN